MRIKKSNLNNNQRVVKLERTGLPRELVLATKRIGEAPIKRVKWLLEFAYMNLEDLSEGRRSDLAWEVRAFVLLSIGELVTSSKKDMNVNVMTAFVRVQTEQVSDETVRKFQALTRCGLQAAFFEGGWEFTYPKRTEKISLGLKAGDESWPGGSGQFEIPSLKELFETNSFSLVKAEMGRLGLCANLRCQKPFVTEKKGKGRFCSPRCSSYVRIAKFRAKA